MRSLVRPVAALAVVLLGLAPAAAYAAWTGAGAGQGTVTATTVNRATAPTATRGTGRVTLTWTAVTLASGTPVTSYDVLRHVGSTTTTVCSVVTVRTCDDLQPLPGAVQYGVVARVGASWRGVESTLTSFAYDQTAPVTTMATAPTSPNPAGWFNGDVTVTLTATDPGGALASGVGEIRYTVNSGSTVVASGSSASFVVSQEQVSTVTYWAVDNAGNTASPLNQAVKLDKTAPVSTTTPASSASWTTTRTVTLTATDTTSGVASIVYQLDGGAVTTYTGVFTLPDGGHTVKYHAIDAAGNVEADRTATIKVDTTAPTVTMTYPTETSTIKNGQWKKGCTPAGLCGTAADATGGSGLATGTALYELRETGTTPTCWSPATDSFTAAACGSYQTASGTQASWSTALDFGSLPSGTFELRVKVTDLAGNTNRLGSTPSGTADVTFTN